MNNRRAAEIEQVYGKVIDGFCNAIHHALFLSQVYPKELFEPVAYGSFVGHRSRHPELNDFIDRQCSSIQKLLAQGSMDRLGIRIMDGNDQAEEWVFEFTLTDLTNFQPPLFADWIGSILVKMNTFKRRRLCEPANPATRTFDILASLKSGLNSYRFGGDNDWVLADTLTQSSCTLLPVKSFYNDHMKV